MRRFPVRAAVAALAAVMTMMPMACGTSSGTAAPPAGPAAGSRPGDPPGQSGTLEAPDREQWQLPERVMDALNIADGSHVGDVRAGSGWFTTHLARRVGPNGVV